jgi:hypothetical protein
MCYNFYRERENAMDGAITDEELAALGMLFDEEINSIPAPVHPPKKVDRILSQADIDALLAQNNP